MSPELPTIEITVTMQHSPPAVSSRGIAPAEPPQDADQQRRRNILLICPEPPAPPTWGFALRVYHLGRQLARDHRVTLLTYDTGDPSRDWRHLDEVFRVRAVRHPGRGGGKRRRQLRSVVSRRSYHLSSLVSGAMQRALDDVLARDDFDLIQVESSQMAGLRFPRTPCLVLDEHNVEHHLMRRVADVETSLPRKVYQQIETRKVHREEITAWRHADGCVVTSTPDEREVRAAAPETPVRVVPNGVDLDYFAPASRTVDAGSIVFVGSINYRPNTDAVHHFVERILPRVLSADPSATFTVVGQGAPESIRRLAGPAVRVAGGVPDVRPYLAGAAVVAIPLRMGGGTRLKVLEGLSMGKALVSSSVGCEGIDVQAGRHLLIADTPEDFAAAVVRLLRDTDLRESLGDAGRRLVEQRYGWEVVGSQLEAFHGELLAVRGAHK